MRCWNGSDSTNHHHDRRSYGTGREVTNDALLGMGLS